MTVDTKTPGGSPDGGPPEERGDKPLFVPIFLCLALRFGQGSRSAIIRRSKVTDSAKKCSLVAIKQQVGRGEF